ncbi:hypothetical protein LOK49_LG08G00791 [Camellia lanceoleosa]|uniref:Uncharacterized protein n=1 Tax=Camellia lanceoleosa TaxID=1840588 RepID=A0ACC0GNX1_9ERIC|nr:hypothetical protein LOK49_LG08G00791 [Camellia lanceoleosa]
MFCAQIEAPTQNHFFHLFQPPPLPFSLSPLSAAMAALRRLIPAAQPEALRRLGFIDSRAYGSASAAQLQYDYDYEEYSDDSEGSIPGRGVQWVIMGDPLAKKQVYAERLSKLLRVPYISMGSLVRQELHPQSSLYKQEILDRIADIDLVVNFKCSEECLLKHVRNGIYSTGQEFLSMGSSGADVQGAWKEKLCIHAEQSKPLVDYYRKQKKLLDFQVVGAPGETWQGLLAALHLQHMNAVNTSQKLTA